MLLSLLCATPPLADAPAAPPAQAAAPASIDQLGFFDTRRLRVAVGASWSHLALDAPGGNSLGFGASAAFEGRYLEAALSLYGHGGFASQDSHARHTGPATSYVRLTGRVAPFPAWLRVMIELGAQAGYDQSWAWCSATSAGDQCGVVPARFSYAGVGGVVTQLRFDRLNLTLGLDALVRGPKTPQVCDANGCQDSPLGSGLFALQGWLEAGFGGVNW
jgi:hypothetical protein